MQSICVFSIFSEKQGPKELVSRFIKLFNKNRLKNFSTQYFFQRFLLDSEGMDWKFSKGIFQLKWIENYSIEKNTIVCILSTI